jgi:hypothetical protein
LSPVSATATIAQARMFAQFFWSTLPLELEKGRRPAAPLKI